MNNNIVRLSETHPLTWRLREDNQPIWLKEYKNKNGYIAARQVIYNMNQNNVISTVKESGLKGRGGAGFPTGLKWSLMFKNYNTETRYLICNADEMEPGTYKDRLLMEQLPHLLIEGIIIASFALSVNRSYIFLRGEYVEAKKNLKYAIEEAKLANFLGKNIFKSNFDLEIIIHTGAGRYICGEETALINSLQGYRANPRSKPPYPCDVGIWGKPTCINNVETLCNLPAIIEHGIDWYNNISLEGSSDTGTKLMGFSGKVRNPGIWELPFGTTAREILEKYAGGMCNNLTLKAWQPGGIGTDLLTNKDLDLPMDSKNIAEAGSRIGTALAIAIDNEVNIVSLIHNIENFFARESCGWCTPCREGLPWIVKILHSIENNKGHPGDIEILEELCQSLGPNKTFCAHTLGAIAPLKSAIKYFRSEFELGINYSYLNKETLKIKLL